MRTGSVCAAWSGEALRRLTTDHSAPIHFLLQASSVIIVIVAVYPYPIVCAIPSESDHITHSSCRLAAVMGSVHIIHLRLLYSSINEHSWFCLLRRLLASVFVLTVPISCTQLSQVVESPKSLHGTYSRMSGRLIPSSISSQLRVRDRPVILGDQLPRLLSQYGVSILDAWLKVWTGTRRWISTAQTDCYGVRGVDQMYLFEEPHQPNMLRHADDNCKSRPPT